MKSTALLHLTASSLCALLHLHAAVPASSETRPPLISLATFFQSPALAQVTISPDGRHVAYLAPDHGRQNLFVREIGQTESRPITASAERDLGGYFWVGSSRIAYAIDEAGKENWRIYAVDLNGGNRQPLTPEIGVQARLVSKLPHDDDHLLVTLNQRDPRLPDLYKIDTRTGHAELILKNDRGFVRYVTDNAGVVRLAIATDGINVALFHRPADAATFERILTTDFRASVGPLFFTADNRYFYALSNRGRDKAAVVLVDPKDGAEIDVVYEHPEFDAGGLLRDDRNGRIVGAYYTGEKSERVFFDEDARNRQRGAEAKLPGLVVDFVSSDQAGESFIVKAWSDCDPGTFYLYEAKTGDLTFIGKVAPWIDPAHLSATNPVTYRSRDGLLIHGYLTRPLHATGPTPTLVVVHGGPWARVHWQADPETQFFASRGYAVLQMNFRGSTGYGRAFFEAGFQQWGKKMQDDVTDGVRWLIQEGVADPQRIGIYGISYGGYATLMGLASTPELYRCGIDDSGVTDLNAWLNNLPPQSQTVRAMFYAMVGNPTTDQAALAAVSPATLASRIKAPLLIAHGGNDPRVRQSDVDRFVAALQANGGEVDYLTRANEGHSFRNTENKLEFYRRAEAFLAKHLGGRKSESGAVPPLSPN